MIASQPRFVARPSVPRLLLLTTGALVLVVGAMWLAGVFGSPPEPGSEWVGWSCIAFFGLATLALIGRLFDRNDQIIIDSRGLYWRQWSEQTIPWTEVRNVREAQVRRSRFLCVDLVHPEWFPSSKVAGRLAGVNRKLGFGDLGISTSGTDKSFDELKQAVFSHWQPPRGI